MNKNLRAILLKRNFKSIAESIEYLWFASYPLKEAFNISSELFNPKLNLNMPWVTNKELISFIEKLNGCILTVDDDKIYYTKNNEDIFIQDLKERIFYVHYSIWSRPNLSDIDDIKPLNYLLKESLNLTQYRFKVISLLSNIINEVVKSKPINGVNIKYNRDTTFGYHTRMDIDPIEFIISPHIAFMVNKWFSDNAYNMCAILSERSVSNISMGNYILDGVSIGQLSTYDNIHKLTLNISHFTLNV